VKNVACAKRLECGCPLPLFVETLKAAEDSRTPNASRMLYFEKETSISLFVFQLKVET